MLKQRAVSEVAMPIATFAKFNEDVFYDGTITPAEFKPLVNPPHHHIS
jgi:hypothetical protein